VNIWVVALDGNLYVHAGASRSTWVEHLEADPPVRIRVSDSIYELAAARVESQQEFDRFSDAYERKYGSRPRNGSVRTALRDARGPGSPVYRRAWTRAWSGSSHRQIQASGS
jgi:hypothetical protein